MAWPSLGGLVLWLRRCRMQSRGALLSVGWALRSASKVQCVAVVGPPPAAKYTEVRTSTDVHMRFRLTKKATTQCSL